MLCNHYVITHRLPYVRMRELNVFFPRPNVAKSVTDAQPHCTSHVLSTPDANAFLLSSRRVAAVVVKFGKIMYCFTLLHCRKHTESVHFSVTPGP